MKKIIAGFVFFVCALPASAQLTTLSGVVSDSNGIAYAGAQIKAQLVTTAGSPVSGQPTMTVNNAAQCKSSGFGSAPCQVPFQGTVGPFSLSVTGTFTVNLQDNTQVTPAATQWLFTINSIGNPPPLGTGPQVCSTQITVSGSAQALSLVSCPALSNIAGGGGALGVPGQNLFYATTYGVVADVIYASSGTCANGSATITTGANENPFTAAAVGKTIAGIDNPLSAGGNANCPPQGTILTFVDAHNVTVSNTPANPNNTINFVAWGTNSGANLSTAYNASYGKGCLILPSGNIFFDVPPFIASTVATTNVVYPPCVIGQYNTNLTPLPSFNVSNCNVGSKACFFMYGNITTSLPNFAYLKDFEFLGATGVNSWNLTGNFATYSAVNFNRVVAWNLWIWNVGGTSANSFTSGANFVGPNYVHAFTVFNTGTSQGCIATGTGGTSAGLNQMTTMEQSYCKGASGSGGALTINTSARLTSYGSQFDTSACPSCDTVTNDGIFTSYGEIILGASGLRAGLATTANGQSYIDGSWIKGAVAGQAVNCSTSGGQVILNGAVLDATASTQPAIKTVSGCNVINNAGTKFNSAYTLNLASGTYSSPGHSVVGSCTGTANASSTLGLYGTGPNATTTTCTSATIGSGIVSPGGATLQNLVVFSTAAGTATAAVTVLRNGGATTITCSLSGVTSCIDTTHSVALAAGDLISLQLVTGAAETVANVKAQVEWN